MSMLGGVPGMPTIDFPAADVAAGAAQEVAKIPDAFNVALDTIRSDYDAAKFKGEDYKLMGGEGGKDVLLTLSKDLEEKELNKQIQNAAGMQIAKGEFSQTAAGQVWKQIEPKIDEQKPTIPDTPLMTGDQIWDKAKEKVQDKVTDAVSKQIQAACDELLKQKQAASS